MTHKETVRVLLQRHGTTYAEDAGIRLADKPAPLWQLLVLTQLLSARITSAIAVAGASELFRAALVSTADFPRLVAGCVRAAHDDDVAEDVRRG